MKENNCGKQSTGRKYDIVSTNPTSTLNSKKTGNGSQFELEEMIKNDSQRSSSFQEWI